ncbi:MAG: Hsp20/alpha crystallin family protein [Candidatus Ornithospirochaeta sp.]|nr:Hsp20/alpha crystallin family protein [Candidatus Ornithospirochaeta sp.]
MADNNITRYAGRNVPATFDDFFDSMMDVFGVRDSKFPAVDVEEDKDGYQVKAELPGYNQDSIKVYIEKHILHIEGKAHEEESEKEGKKYILRERRSASFSRTFSLPDGIEENNLEAKFENGILSIRLPKKPEEKPQRIEVKLG